ncbi:MFS transporter [Yoonia sediminilitoris]|uniref:GPH family glycoside/pentoside/hexuronide:cation symporter n=1 Tax=Yoonia sediminilitoris TaxID=1286148 RepID=A0A2T6KN60_9RHOB|nr:MFS transporter [Yoonia sediminilitoris]PUB17604.1 GPH family glycoside/pentoside/hexuronide:cation symporter [Yoonia sediminilitoris]RCW97899.1 GPH family glycoside/pentoside/hexuronide:cation symporter [Yoonia sediminilitoris]
MKALSERLPAYTGFAAVLSGAGLPIYIYAPKYYADTYGVSLTALGGLLFALRLFDVVQDPFLGWISERLTKGKRLIITLTAVVLALSMIGLFAIAPPISPIWWFGLTVTGLFSAFSFLTINFYAQGVSKAGDSPTGHVRLAAWRESGALMGVCIAAVIPTALIGVVADPYATFAYGFAATAMVAALFMWPEWKDRVQQEPSQLGEIVADATARKLLILALVNATPLAVSSTLFLFYVESRLGAVGWEGPLLLLFFLAAAVSSPVWSALARRFGEKPVLLVAMVLAVASFAYTLTLSTGDVIPFAIVCVLSGATIGADLTLLPAMFAKRMSVISPNGGQGFGLWNLVNKFTLAFAAVLLLPLLERAGFEAGANDLPEGALYMLTVLYALVPSLLKLVAIGLLVATKLEE